MEIEKVFDKLDVLIEEIDNTLSNCDKLTEEDLVFKYKSLKSKLEMYLRNIYKEKYEEKTFFPKMNISNPNLKKIFYHMIEDLKSIIDTVKLEYDVFNE